MILVFAKGDALFAAVAEYQQLSGLQQTATLDVS